MIICRKPLILFADAVGAAAVAGLIAAVAWFVVLPYSRQHGRLPQLENQIARAHRLRERLNAQNAAATTWVAANEQRLREQPDPAVADVGAFLEALTQECRAAGIMLEQFEPIHVPPAPNGAQRAEGNQGQDYRSWDVQLRGLGRFPDFARLITQIESRSPYVYVREFDVEGPPPGRPSACRLSWTIRVHYLPDASLTSAAAEGEPGP